MGQITTLCGHSQEEGRTNKIGVEAVLIDSVMYKRPPVMLGPAFGDWLLLQRQISRKKSGNGKITRTPG